MSVERIAELEKEVARLNRSVEFTQQWYAVRFERLKDLGKERDCWPEMAAIMANGSATRQLEDGSFHYDAPTYDQQMNALRYRAEQAERGLQTSRRMAAVETLIALRYRWNGKTWVAP